MPVLYWVLCSPGRSSSSTEARVGISLVCLSDVIREWASIPYVGYKD